MDNTLVFDISGEPGSGYISIPFTIPGSTTVGTTFQFYATIEAEADTDVSNNRDTISGSVLNSYDPNAKTVNKPQWVDAGETETFQYVIHFQNDGNYEALNVVLRDTLSPNLDLSTFVVKGAKHPVTTTIDPITREVVFTFHNIHLTPHSENTEGSQGFVVYEVKEMESLAMNVEITNTAYIYFDFNPPIPTNTTSNINTNLAIGKLERVTLLVYPNPAKDWLTIESNDVEFVTVTDLQGRVVQTAKKPTSNAMSVSDLPDGIYHFMITTKKGSIVQKLTVQK